MTADEEPKSGGASAKTHRARVNHSMAGQTTAATTGDTKWMGGGGGRTLSTSVPNLREVLPYIQKEGELQKVLTDERIRADQHRTNFQLLKTQYERLSQEHAVLKAKTAAAASAASAHTPSGPSAEAVQQVIARLEAELRHKARQVAELEGAAITPEKYELLKLELLRELEVPFRQKMDQMEAECGEFRSKYNALRHDYNFLKSEFEFEKQEHERLAAEADAKYAAEVERLRLDKEAAVQRFSAEAEKESSKVQSLLKENAHLTHRANNLQRSLEEKDAQSENQESAQDHVARFQATALTDLNAKVKVLEAANGSLKAQNESLQEELRKATEFSQRNNEKFIQVERENMRLHNQMEQLAHEESLLRNRLKLESSQARNEVAQERDALKAELEEVTTRVEVLQHSLEKQKAQLAAKEREFVKRLQNVKDAEWLKMSQLQEAKAELECRLQEAEVHQTDAVCRETELKERLQDKVSTVEKEKADLEKQVYQLQAKLEAKVAAERDVEREREDASGLKRRLHAAQNELLGLQNVESELSSDNQRLKSQNDAITDQVNRLQQQLEVIHDRNQAELRHWEGRASAERVRFTERVSFLEGEVEKLAGKLRRAAEVHARKKQKMQHKVSRLRQKAELLDAKEQLLEAAEKHQPEEDQLLLETKERLRKSEQRYKEMLGALPGDGHRLPPPDRLAAHRQTAAPAAAVAERGTDSLCSNADRQYLKELQNLKERLRRLSAAQKEQMVAFTGSPHKQQQQEEKVDPSKDHIQLSGQF